MKWFNPISFALIGALCLSGATLMAEAPRKKAVRTASTQKAGVKRAPKTGKTARTTKPAKRQVTSTPAAPEPTPRTPDAVPATSFQAVTGAQPRFFFNSGFGVSVLHKPGLALQAQLQFSLSKRSSYYLGPDVTYSLYSSGSSLVVALGLWYDVRIYGAPRLSTAVGLVAGGAFNSNLPNFSNTTYAVYADLALVQEVDDLISVRGQFRPGLLGNAFSYVMSFQVAFRFL